MIDFKQVLTGENIYYGQANINGIDCSIGYIKKFRWSWFGTQLKTFIIIGQTEMKIDKNLIENFSSSCHDYAIKHNKGLPRGLQSGVGSIAILVGRDIGHEAVRFCQNPYKKHFGSFEVPVLCNLEKREVSKYLKTPVWGKVYFPFFTETIERITNKF
jgi:hypothetical protein